MLLTEDGHLDIEKVKQLNEEEFADEAETWGVEQFCEWNGLHNFVTLDEFFEKYHQKIRELWHEDEKNNIFDRQEM